MEAGLIEQLWRIQDGLVYEYSDLLNLGWKRKSVRRCRILLKRGMVEELPPITGAHSRAFRITATGLAALDRAAVRGKGCFSEGIDGRQDPQPECQGR